MAAWLNLSDACRDETLKSRTALSYAVQFQELASGSGQATSTWIGTLARRCASDQAAIFDVAEKPQTIPNIPSLAQQHPNLSDFLLFRYRYTCGFVHKGSAYSKSVLAL